MDKTFTESYKLSNRDSIVSLFFNLVTQAQEISCVALDLFILLMEINKVLPDHLAIFLDSAKDFLLLTGFLQCSFPAYGSPKRFSGNFFLIPIINC